MCMNSWPEECRGPETATVHTTNSQARQDGKPVSHPQTPAGTNREPSRVAEIGHASSVLCPDIPEPPPDLDAFSKKKKME